MAKVFISFIHEEVEYAKLVHVFIREVLGEGSESFLASDPFQIPAGEMWLEKIKAELEQAKVMVLMLTRISVERPWVNFEAGAAWILNKKIIPVCFGGLQKGTLPKPYSSYQALDLFEPQDQYYLVTSIAKHLGMVPPPPAWHPFESALGGTTTLEQHQPYKKLRGWLRTLSKPSAGENE